MAKRQRSDRGEARTTRRPAQPKQHLYVVVDDWERGFSVRKLDVDAFDSDAISDPQPERFKEPPVARMEALHAHSWSFVAHGTKIFAMQPPQASPAIPAFDVHTRGLTICPWPTSHGDHGRPLLASLAGKLFLFLHPYTDYLGDPPAGAHNRDVPWSWTTIRKPLPFKASFVTSYAAHPDGRTLFVSAQVQGTFSFDAERLEWTHHGGWLLPFTGQAYFDTELEAWLGLCRLPDGAGRLCSCQVAAADSTTPPSWKLGEDRLFHTKSALHLGATLVYRGNSKFCLVESLLQKEEHINLGPDSRSYRPPRLGRVLSMTTFGLKYNYAGELRILSRRARSCKMFKQAHYLHDPSLDPVAFWL